MYIADGKIEAGDLTQNAMGGTELLAHRFLKNIDQKIAEPYQIFLSRRTHDFLPDKAPILWCHDLAQDPSALQALGNGLWRDYALIVFVSYWQRQQYIDRFNIPYSRTAVIKNFIDPVPIKKREGPIKLGYWSTPHRGLEILSPVFDHLCKTHDNITLDVFSSFKLYGWEDRDEPFAPVFEKLLENPKVTYHGAKSNEEVRDRIGELDILAYPSIWPETSCLVLMEAMSAGLACVHPDYAALPETACAQTFMYNYNEEPNAHANIFANTLEAVINSITEENRQDTRTSDFANALYGGNIAKTMWENILSDAYKSFESPETLEITY